MSANIYKKYGRKTIQNLFNMTDRNVLDEKVYNPIRDLKNRFYQSKTQDEWEKCKTELKTLLPVAQELMDADFYTKFKDGVVQSIEKMYGFKQKLWNKPQYPVKQSYIFQDNLANALAKYIELKTKMLELEYESRCHIEDEKNF